MSNEKNLSLFNKTIDGNKSWAELFQSISAFKPLIEAIFKVHDLEAGKIENLTPGTNAVFRIHNKVIKIFAPIESGYNTGSDYAIELSSLKHANEVQIPAPLLLHAGEMNDRYLFHYIIMEFINGKEAEHKLKQYRTLQKRNFAYRLKEITSKLNTKVQFRDIPIVALADIQNSERWSGFSKAFCQDRKAYIQNSKYPEYVYTHGDLTGENMIIDEKEEIYIIDFADSRIAPYFYEWPPIVFALFGCDQIMMEAYFGDYHKDEFYDILTLSFVLHEFGSNILGQICNLHNITPDSIKDMANLKLLLRTCVEGGGTKVS
ncbi:phosphotransferase [Anaerocolumna sp. AGMB13020]|uniref:phosphotransferase n=1 Tax=Anaerocolumna sp. AGMB13020 TaxID=3081750 RepID=UPI002954C4A8|nr:phosphotransferase [Anaerocolumna sp. AGMB13020]WOO37035.1 phosphotransferase [Anaerocolumna sp. AGMB13020]